MAGVVHEAEYVFDAKSTARIGAKNLEALRRGTLRGYATGGYVSASPVSYPTAANSGSGPASGGNTTVQVNNYTGQQVSTEEQTDAAGNRRVVMTVGDQMAAAINTPGNAADKAIRSRYGSKPRTIRR